MQKKQFVCVLPGETVPLPEDPHTSAAKTRSSASFDLTGEEHRLIPTGDGQGDGDGGGGGEAADKSMSLVSGYAATLRPSLAWPYRQRLVTMAKRYVPRIGDLVIGTVGQKFAEHYTVDIGAPMEAVISSLAFPMATKRNKPNLSQGSILLCQVKNCGADVVTELTCCLRGDVKGWTTGENYLGEFREGVDISVPLAYAHYLQSDDCDLIELMGEIEKQFEVAVGANGRVWLKGEDGSRTLRLCECIRGCVRLSHLHAEAFVRRLLEGSGDMY
uniref:K Homology domain-containing protein n=1 Tax=Chromera velia CCMP2878 TaxID=1169474 RepID=A0A0G4HJ59_9ALVE|mmetsp:Transcript_44055/g.86979  ORF Transcript_44055/g.86979 Transcript_44055/m.86979 type:complete len:273 (+) Transcript_44055:156-974(+)|eukprot:Cvel_28138.t1-p1 / transcript=Cvel_28138.t1 / gene=Cvel_28138 / organism=Chromera_velia_CCMP2878 / gene_product=Putative exosome complex component rrp40, putative / transcript_product=Putative exosome complex component rrp40, putative / location=Cvel_scaffold3632:8045-11367(-) / protein_length=272 / sequence_SO=supercontig / SO=protein_coding / is_pseudo=false